jgi:hypothetical protein
MEDDTHRSGRRTSCCGHCERSLTGVCWTFFRWSASHQKCWMIHFALFAQYYSSSSYRINAKRPITRVTWIPKMISQVTVERPVETNSKLEVLLRRESYLFWAIWIQRTPFLVRISKYTTWNGVMPSTYNSTLKMPTKRQQHRPQPQQLLKNRINID